jgi:hypothetical protein
VRSFSAAATVCLRRSASIVSAAGAIRTVEGARPPASPGPEFSCAAHGRCTTESAASRSPGSRARDVVRHDARP